jgi:hypothetical protein
MGADGALEHQRRAFGLHRPGINDPEFSALPSADAYTVYKRTLQEITRYLAEMEAPRPLSTRLRKVVIENPMGQGSRWRFA